MVQSIMLKHLYDISYLFKLLVKSDHLRELGSNLFRQVVFDSKEYR